VARSISTDPYHTFRFGVRFDGQIPMGFCTVSIRPNGAHPGPGKVVMSTALMPLIMEFLGQRKRAALDILAFHISDEFGVNGKPSMTFRLHGVQPCLARLNPIEWDATGKEILMTEMTLDYERLKMIQDGIPMSQPIPCPRVRPQPTIVM
jgi:hypothetical protein